MKIQTHRELDEEDLFRIERLVEASSAGPWYSYVVGRDADAESNRVEVGWCNELGSFRSMEIVGGTVADQDFIASARQDVPRLLFEVRALRARLASLREGQVDLPMQPLPGIADGSASGHAPERRRHAR